MASAVSGQFVSTRGLRFHYAQRGTGEPVILLHGFPQTSRCWHALLETLSGDHALFAPDTRGFGASDKPRIRVTLDLLARDLIDFMDALGIEKATVIGHDYGGMIASAAALQYGERVSRLVMIDCTSTIWIPWGAHGYWFKVPGLAESFFEKHHEAFIDSIFQGGEFELPAMPAGPFPATRGFPKQSWCDLESLRQYRDCYRDPDSQWSAISYYRDALPFHRLGDRGYELIQPREIEEIWLGEGGYFAHPSFGEFHAYAPERIGQRYDGPTLYLYTKTLIPGAFPATQETQSGSLPTQDNPAAAAFVDHFPKLRGVPFDSGHFIPEQETRRLADTLMGWFDETRESA